MFYFGVNLAYWLCKALSSMNMKIKEVYGTNKAKSSGFLCSYLSNSPGPTAAG